MPATILVGTRKGAFIYRSDESRSKWEISQPCMPGWTIYHMAVDARRDTPRIFAAGSHWAWGPVIARSDDGGTTWDNNSPGIAFPADMGETVGAVWNIRPGLASQPGVVYAGTQPAGLFKSIDWGETWATVEELNRHKYRSFWGESGGGGSALHSIELHPTDEATMYVSIATGGTYITRDSGATWTLQAHGVIATNAMAKQMEEDFKANYPQFGDLTPPVPEGVDPAAMNEFHKMQMDVANPNRIWAQTHIGVFRSDDGGDYWTDVTAGLPSFHGFPIAVSRNGEGAAYVVPLAFEADNFRVCPGQFTVYRTRDDGATWQALTNGLPGPNDYQSAYRESMDTDGLTPEGVYVGTTNGEVYASNDGGDRWQRLPGTLPPILSVTAVAG